MSGIVEQNKTGAPETSGGVVSLTGAGRMTYGKQETVKADGDGEATYGNGLNDVAGAIVKLRVSEIESDEKRNIRYFKEDPDSIKLLAAAIENDGQEVPIKVGAKKPNGRHPIIYGHRRYAAILFNERTREKDDPECLVLAVVDEKIKDTDERARLQAQVMENIPRKDLSPMEKAYMFARVREVCKWQNGAYTRNVAEFCGVSAATVTEHEKLLKHLTEKEQERVHTGELKRDAAIALIEERDVAKREKVFEEAKRIEQERQITDRTKSGAKKKQNEAIKAAVKTAGELAREAKAEGKDVSVNAAKAFAKERALKEAKAAAKRPEEVTRVTRESIERAKKKLGVEKPEKQKSKRVSDILEFFMAHDGPASHAAVREFVVAFKGWVKAEKGCVGERKLEALFDACTYKKSK